MPRQFLKPKRVEGFVLPAVLAAVAGLALVLAGVAHGLQTYRREVERHRASVELQRLGLTAEARLAFLAITEPLGLNGLMMGSATSSRTPSANGGSPLLIDGTGYYWSESGRPTSGSRYICQIQDETGLVNLDHSSFDVLSRLFQSVGLSPYDATLMATEVVHRNSEPLPKQPMQRPVELLSLFSGNMKLTAQQRNLLVDLTVAEPDMLAVNINTAPAAVLMNWFSFSDRQAVQAVRDRQQTVFTNLSQINAASSNPGGSFTSSAGRFRFRLIDRSTGTAFQSTMILSPRDAERPVWIQHDGLDVARLNFPQGQGAFPEIPNAIR